MPLGLMETVRNTLEQVEEVFEQDLEAANRLTPMEKGLLKGNVFLCGLDNREKVILASINAVVKTIMTSGFFKLFTEGKCNAIFGRLVKN